ncbi:MAG: hypothetical protein R3Y47_12845 [Lachnospiraceae bacterium]
MILQGSNAPIKLIFDKEIKWTDFSAVLYYKNTELKKWTLADIDEDLLLTLTQEETIAFPECIAILEVKYVDSGIYFCEKTKIIIASRFDHTVFDNTNGEITNAVHMRVQTNTIEVAFADEDIKKEIQELQEFDEAVVQSFANVNESIADLREVTSEIEDSKQDNLTAGDNIEIDPVTAVIKAILSWGAIEGNIADNDDLMEWLQTLHNEIEAIVQGMDWKEAVATYADIATTYPTPQDGWTVNVNDTDLTYRYTGTAWIEISANAIPNATSTVNGLMSKESYAKLNGIDLSIYQKNNTPMVSTVGDAPISLAQLLLNSDTLVALSALTEVISNLEEQLDYKVSILIPVFSDETAQTVPQILNSRVYTWNNPITRITLTEIESSPYDAFLHFTTADGDTNVLEVPDDLGIAEGIEINGDTIPLKGNTKYIGVIHSMALVLIGIQPRVI